MKGHQLIQLIRDNKLQNHDFEFIAPDGRSFYIQDVTIKPGDKKVVLSGERAPNVQMTIDEMQ